MSKSMKLASELGELERAAILGTDYEMNISEQELPPNERIEEIKRAARLSGEKILRVDTDDIPILSENLRSIMDDTETRAGRSKVVESYHKRVSRDTGVLASDSFSGAGHIYAKARHRYTGPTERSIRPRLELARAACDALKAKGFEVDYDQICCSMFDGTRLMWTVEHAYAGTEGNGGELLANAWSLISETLDAELGLVRWFHHIRDNLVRDPILLGRMMDCGRALDFSKNQSLEETCLEDWYDNTFEPVTVEGAGRVNFPQHVNDLALAPSVSLFRFHVWSGKGKLKRLDRHADGTAAKLTFWREVQLSILPNSSGMVGPYFVNRLRATLHLDKKSSTKISLVYPFTRLLPHSDVVPIDIGEDVLYIFESKDPFEDVLFPVSESISTQFASVWGARSDIVPLFLRYIIDPDGRPISSAVFAESEKSFQSKTAFAPDTIGEVIERATQIPDRAAGLGGLLRRDFFSKARIFDSFVTKRFFVEEPFAFERAWGS